MRFDPVAFLESFPRVYRFLCWCKRVSDRRHFRKWDRELSEPDKRITGGHVRVERPDPMRRRRR